MQHPITPGTPDSASILFYNTGNAANEKRNKSLMNCFRDRSTSSYPKRFDKVPILRDAPHNRTRPNKLALLKSSSTRDIIRLVNDEKIIMNKSAAPQSMTKQSTGSLSSTSSSEINKRVCNNKPIPNMLNVLGLDQRIANLEKDLNNERAYTKQLEIKLNALSASVDEILAIKQMEKRKKSGSLTTKPSNGEPNAVMQPSRLAVWMKLSYFWKHRPSIQTLKERNIYNDEPCFDTDIESVLKHETHNTIPKIVVDCCDLIEEKYRKSSQPIEGIYRQCGDYNKIQTLRFNIDAFKFDSLREPSIDIHTLTGVLKLFLREIKTPLVSVNEAKTFIGKPNQWLLTEMTEKIDILKRLVRSLPEVNRNTMEYLFGHFNRLTKVPLQHISAETLSLSVTPSIFHTVQDDVHIIDIQHLLRENEILGDCVKLMIQYQSRIFECTAESRLRRISVRRLRKTLSHPDLLFQNLF